MIKELPVDPLTLPEDVLKHAYGDARPVAKQLSELTAFYSATAYRGNARALRPASPSTTVRARSHFRCRKDRATSWRS